MILSELLQRVEVVATTGSEDPEVRGVTYDSRTVKPGWLFVAVSGHNIDGSEFITQAVSNGASIVVSENALDLGAGVVHVQVPRARRALAEIASAYYGDLSRQMTVVGVTGTNGKTTTTYMIRDVLRDGGHLPGLLGTVAYEIGDRTIPAARTTPESLDIHSMFQMMKEAECDATIMEVSSHAIALHRVHGIDFNISVFTNLTQDHLDYHRDMETYFDVKARLFEVLKHGPGRSAVINMDDPWGRKLIDARKIEADVLTYGFHERSDVFAADAEVDAEGTSFKVTTPWGDADMRLKLLGRFNIHNALAAIAVGGLMGINLDVIAASLANIEAIPGRLELVRNRKGRKIFVDYAHTDDALKNVLSTLREICRGKLIVVFGCGGNRDVGKRAKMGARAAELSDYSIVTSDNPRDEDPGAIVAAILEGFADQSAFEVVLDRRAAIEKGIKKMGRKDVLLIAGKGHEAYQEVKGTVIPFDDREIVREVLG